MYLWRWFLDGKCTHDQVLFCLSYRSLHFDILGIAHRTDSYFCILVPRNIVSNVRARITYKRPTLTAMMLSLDHSEFLLTNATLCT